ncbi:Hypothetical predicted protein [Olea europaea subsp. europaea]|uniref:Uncharacterized protein n=1 Tax=Olea europaea subsp. europaea TaxID=158383 RepID=A0A8S0Q0A0_OLEEU|nr:Hypothetical predicted protein [Olea europaea subsp. europaea]
MLIALAKFTEEVANTDVVELLRQLMSVNQDLIKSEGQLRKVQVHKPPREAITWIIELDFLLEVVDIPDMKISGIRNIEYCPVSLDTAIHNKTGDSHSFGVVRLVIAKETHFKEIAATE